MSLNIVIEVPEDAEHYLESSARLRGISKTALMRRVLETVLTEKLVLSVLDDEGAPQAKVKKPGRPPSHDKPPKDRLFDALTKRSPPVTQVKTSRTISPHRQYKPQPTRTELQQQLQQAVLNTAAMPVE